MYNVVHGSCILSCNHHACVAGTLSNHLPGPPERDFVIVRGRGRVYHAGPPEQIHLPWMEKTWLERALSSPRKACMGHRKQLQPMTTLVTCTACQLLKAGNFLQKVWIGKQRQSQSLPILTTGVRFSPCPTAGVWAPVSAAARVHRENTIPQS